MRVRPLALAGSAGCLYPAALFLFAAPAQAACDLSPTAGNSVYICDSGNDPDGLTDTDGTNNLTMDAPGGTVTGNVTFGTFVDTVTIHAGTINGQVNQGSGQDVFTMTGGTIGALLQGGDRDTANISGGHIIGVFSDGDVVTMTGGRIGTVDLLIGNNEMRMSGGSIDASIIAGQNNDLIEISGIAQVGTFINTGSNSGGGGDIIRILGGSVGGEIVTFNESAPNHLIDGNDRVEVSGGTIGGGIRFGQGTDNFVWQGGGSIGGNVLMGAGDDTARLVNLTEANFAAVQIDGGSGVNGNNGLSEDRLVFEDTQASTVSRYINWEAIDLTASSELTLDGNLVLGDAISGTGELSIDGSSTLFAGDGVNAAVQAFTGGLAATVSNGGTIDLTNGTPSAADTFTVVGNYIGTGGIIRLDTVLESDGAPSDKLVIQDGNASGTTGLAIVNFGGGGALTTADGILVVEVVNATTDPGAFNLASPVAFGAFEYLLFRGGVTAGNEENWYLRSTLINPEAPEEPGIPLLRSETAVYSALPPVARDMALATLGTFHERRGEQAFMAGGENFSAAWGRVFGKSLDQSWSGTVSPSIDGALGGIQAGLDMLRWEDGSGSSNVAGLMLGYTGLGADVAGAVQGQSDLEVGRLDLDGYSFGGYFTHVGAGGWYVDAVVMGTWFGGDASTDRGIGIDPDGDALTLSLEAGAPIAISEGWTLEPQAQLVWQDISFDDQDDTLSTVSFSTDDGLTGRIGARLQGTFQTASGEFKPYLKANLWHSFEADETVWFGPDPIDIESESTMLELGGGIAHKFTDKFSGFATADYSFDVDGDRRREFEGNVGLQVQW
jgi:autotransporter family porin